MEPIILASSSPRRQDILKMLNIPFQVISPNIDEDYSQTKTPFKVAEQFAKAKIQAVLRMMPPKQVIPWVLSADTVIIMNNKIYGKPVDNEQAFDFISKFQGKTHSVITSMALYNGSKRITISKTAMAKVTFAPMSDKEIDWYVSTGEWHGASGGYRIQGVASCFIEKIEGTSSCVTGLPIFELYDMLKEQGYSILE